MRRVLIALAGAGLLAVTACSDSDSGGENAAGGSTEQFCADFEELEERYADDPEADADAIIGDLEGLEPPDEIADDFQQIIDVSRETADVDFNDPDAVAEAQETSQQAAGAQERVGQFLQDECDIDPSGG